MQRLLKSTPWPVLAYVLTLVGFVFLGLFVASLAYGAAFAPALGSAMAAAWASAVGCVWLRRRQIAVADPQSDIVLGLDPIRGDQDRRAFARYLQRYRHQGDTEGTAAAARRVRTDEPADYGAIAVSTTVSSVESPAAARISRKASTIASVSSCGSSRVLPSESTEMLSWST